MSREQLKKLATPIPKSLQSETGRSGLKAADHTVTVQWLLAAVGPYDLEIVEKLYSVPKASKNGEKVLNGVIGCLTCEIDGRKVSIEEAGGVENALNQDGDGERLKHALSDFIKRAAMRLGVGLNIWAQNHYFLDKSLEGPKKDAVGPQDSNPSSEPSESASDSQVPEELAKEVSEAPGSQSEIIDPNDDSGPAKKSRKAWLSHLITQSDQYSMDDVEELLGHNFDEITENQCEGLIQYLESV